LAFAQELNTIKEANEEQVCSTETLEVVDQPTTTTATTTLTNLENGEVPESMEENESEIKEK
jgi:hypothetical protein